MTKLCPCAGVPATVPIAAPLAAIRQGLQQAGMYYPSDKDGALSVPAFSVWAALAA